MGLYSPNQPSEIKSDTIDLINPSIKEFKTTYLDDYNKEIEIVLAPLQAKAFPTSVGIIILDHLIDFILNQGGFSYKTSVTEERKKIREKCVLYE